MTDVKAFGGDIHTLYMTANVDIAAAEDAYVKMTKRLNDEFAEGDTKKYGRAFDAWDLYRKTSQFVMYMTSMSLLCARAGLGQAILEFTFVDGDSAKGITKAGEVFLEKYGNPNETPPKYIVDPADDPPNPFDD